MNYTSDSDSIDGLLRPRTTSFHVNFSLWYQPRSHHFYGRSLPMVGWASRTCIFVFFFFSMIDVNDEYGAPRVTSSSSTIVLWSQIHSLWDHSIYQRNLFLLLPDHRLPSMEWLEWNGGGFVTVSQADSLDQSSRIWWLYLWRDR